MIKLFGIMAALLIVDCVLLGIWQSSDAKLVYKRLATSSFEYTDTGTK